MRADMAKVIVERPRHRHADGYPRAKLKALSRDFAPKRETMGGRYATKSLNENLKPLIRYINKQVGRPWRLVYAEISAHLSMRSAVQKHVLDHLRDFVIESVWMQGKEIFYLDRLLGVRKLESRGAWKQLYVCPKNGLLRIARLPPKAIPAPDPNRRVIDPARELRRLNGIWFDVHVAEMPRDEEVRKTCFDVIEKCAPEHPRVFDWRNQIRGESRPPPGPVLWQLGRYAAGKRQLSKWELRERGLSGGAPNSSL